MHGVVFLPLRYGLDADDVAPLCYRPTLSTLSLYDAFAVGRTGSGIDSVEGLDFAVLNEVDSQLCRGDKTRRESGTACTKQVVAELCDKNVLLILDGVEELLHEALVGFRSERSLAVGHVPLSVTPRFITPRTSSSSLFEGSLRRRHCQHPAPHVVSRHLTLRSLSHP